MTTIETHASGSQVHATSSDSALGAFLVGVGAWATTTDHKRIGRLFTGCALLIAIAAAALGAVIGVERISATGYSLLDQDSVTQIFSLYRVGLSFGVMLPLLLGVAIAVVPLQVGAKTVAFARLAMFGFWMWLAGVGLAVGSTIANGGPGGGSEKMVDLFLLGMGIAVIGALAAAVSVVTTVLTNRAPGMTLLRVPMSSWSALTGGVALILTLPVLLGTLVYLYVDHRYARVAFGGNKGISDWMGWSLTQPQTYVYVAMGAGVLAEIAAVVSGKRQVLRPVLLTGIAIVSLAALGGATQVQHGVTWTNTSGSDKVKELIPFLIFNALPLLGVLVVLGVSLLGIAKSKPRLVPAMAPALLGLGMVLTGMVGHLVALFGPAQLAGTVFEEGEFIYVGYGALLIGLAAVSYWGPKLWGRVLPSSAVLGISGLAFLGTVLAALPMYIAGFANQPANVANNFSYSGPQELWNTASAAGHALVAVSVLLFVLTALRAFTAGEVAGDDPWDAQSLEWSVSSPAPSNNFVSTPSVTSAEPLLDIKPAGGQ
ncbi:MAG: cbb3-type cytochrome c oxidase subunit I [Ilumatobacteraceae bacterium]|jgi:heme/copper-type cytochrome/quinol oxidase subunit 1|nr:cbb3-type cytochrome c oxidase subunit I [Ilumatobacteraceae bacterium]MDP4703025.1 cbb3-type cytochrome c oxidase subunit I [Ilumatobacteraceae bacterium]